ncbi:MAG: hypothetical protein GX568_03475 [Candidatus Gastranaerophilales bacterium]|jgi:hypothetical protein|nr:hypothetical protein [Candidatus Gastranaerophilales bacterium]
MSLEELRRKRDLLEGNTDIILDNIDVLANESKRVADVAHNAEVELEKLEAEFERQTGLNGTDCVFLFFATALQVLRWVIIDMTSHFGESSDQSKRLAENDKSIKDRVKERNADYRQKHLRNPNDPNSGYDITQSDKGYKNWMDIISSAVPYDAIKGSAQFGLDLNGRNHRMKTLGHDPILGWVFGPMNIMTDTLTMNTLRTFYIDRKTHYFVKETNLFTSFQDCYYSFREDKLRLAAAVFAQAVHLESDKFTKMGLPIPALSVFNEDFAGKLYLEQYDSLCLIRDLQTIGKQAGYAIAINMIIGLVHGLFYDPSKYSSRDVYEVKTRKILLYSNLIASASNVIYVAVSTYLGKGDAWKSLDFGGIAVTLYRLVTDLDFIRLVKEEFILGGFNKLIQGNQLNLKEISVWDC